MNSYIHEKTQQIPLKKTSSFESTHTHGLNHIFIDPSKMSPPNTFMDKLIKRMDDYYSPSSNKTFDFDEKVKSKK
jgi:hypothetical protein